MRRREAPPQRQRHVERLREVGDLLLGPRRGEERLVRAERVEPVAAPGRVRVHERRAREPQRVDPPEEDADVRDVVAARAATAIAPHSAVWANVVERAGLERAGELERASRRAGRPSPPRGARTWFMYCVVREQLEELDRAGRPAGDVARELLEHRGRALAAPVARSCWRPRPAATRPAATTPCSGR